MTILVGVDRDGTINRDNGYFGRQDTWKEELEIYGGVVEGIRKLKINSRFKVIVASNQAGVARGFFDCKRVEEINAEIKRRLEQQEAFIDGIYYCPFIGRDYAREKGIPFASPWVKETKMRKPKTGMLKQAAQELGLRFEDLKIYFIGDKKTDVETGLNAKGVGIFFDNGENVEDKFRLEELLKKVEYKSRIFVVKNLVEATDIILSNR